MDVKKKLLEILGDKFIFGNSLLCAIASHLIDNTVTVQECGEWEEIEDDWSMEIIYRCSICKEEVVTIEGTPIDNLLYYCPHCGAKMMPQPPKGE